MSSIERMFEKLKTSTPSGKAQREVTEPKFVDETTPIETTSIETTSITGATAYQRRTRDINIDMAKLENLGFIAPPQDRAKLAEEYRRIKRPLLSNAFGKGKSTIELGNLIMVASALPGEGKTFNTINLAMSLANEMDHTVLVVDIDVLNPATTRLFGLKDEPGLTDVLSNPHMGLEDVIHGTNLPNLKIMPAGQHHAHANELLASEQMKRLAYELSTRYPDRIVILDAPPLLLTSEASVVAGLVGQVLLVVEAGKTAQNAVKEAVNLLDDNDNKVVGIVLNKNRNSNKGQYGAYYGAYGEERD